MAIKTFYGSNTLLGAASPKWGELKEVSPGATATSSPATGWTTGTATPTKYKGADMGEKRSAPTVATVAPDETINNDGGTNRSGWRTKEKLTITFEAGNWTLHNVARAVTAANTGKQSVTARLWKGSNEAGTGATVLSTGATPLTGAEVVSLKTTEDQDSSVVWAAPEVVLAEEFLFVEIAIKILAAGGGATQDFVLRYGETGCRIESAPIKEGGGGAANTPLALLL